MRSSQAGLIVVVWALAAPALAQDADRTAPTAKETAAIDTCLAGKEGSAQRRACIGRVAEPCQTTPDGSSTVGMTVCLDREQVIWDRLLNQTYRKAMAAFDEAGQRYLKGVQQTWLTFRAQACEWPGRVYPGGTIGVPLSNACFMQQTALRALDLMEIQASLEQR